MKALIPASAGQTSTLEHEGGTVYLSVHDAEVVRQKAAWTQRLSKAHPDHAGGSTAAFIRVRRQQAIWQAQETAWQAHHAPIVNRTTRTSQEVAAALSAPVRSVCAILYRKAKRAQSGHGGTARERLLGALLDGLPHTPVELCDVAGLRDSTTLSSAMSRLRAKGLCILRTSSQAKDRVTYQLVLPTQRTH